MTEFLTLISPAEARKVFFSHLDFSTVESESVGIRQALNRVSTEEILASHPLPSFTRSSVDGYAVKASDTFGATESMPAYMKVAGEVEMGARPTNKVEPGSVLLIHTGGMLPDGADAVVMLEYVQQTREGEVEVGRPVAVGENIIRIGEDVKEGELILAKGTRIRPSEIGGLAAFGILSLRLFRYVVEARPFCKQNSAP